MVLHLDKNDMETNQLSLIAYAMKYGIWIR